MRSCFPGPLVLMLGLAGLAGPVVGQAVETPQARVPQSAAEVSLSFAPLVRAAAPAVVNIYARTVTEARSPFADDPIFGDFFRQYRARPRVTNSLGSGVILTADGIVVSNYHVVGMATEIRVVTTDRREYDARVVLADKASDLAILQLDQAEGLPFLDLRDSDGVEVGELALAIGNPFGVGQTVSMGIVSATGRNQLGLAVFEDFIQTDAAVNPGNSGGALINTQGQLVGINTAIFSKSGGFQGISFAIPSPQASRVVNQIIENGRVVRGYLGMSMSEITQYALEQLAIPADKALVITELSPEGPAAQAGLLVGDVVTAIAGVPILSGVLTQKQVVNTPPGEYLTLEFYRQGVLMEANVLVGVRPS